LTHCSTATGTKDIGSVSVGALDGQFTQADSPGTTVPPVTVGTGVALAVGAAGAVVWPDVPLTCADPHPAASTPATSSAAGTAHARRPARAIEAIGVIMSVPRF
jgi:hypothetical protein